MGQTVYRKLFGRLAALAAVSFCLVVVVLRQDGPVGLGMAQQPMQSFQAPAPVIVARNDPNSPLVISAEHLLAKSEQAPEVVFNVTNVTNKTITAYAIRFDVASGSKVDTSVTLIDLELSAIDLPPNRSRDQADTYENFSNSQHRVTLSVDYVEFSDGKSWGVDTTKSAEKVAGARAAIETLRMRFAGIIRSATANDLPEILESMATIELPAEHSDSWNFGFRSGTRSLTNRLKRANQAGGLAEVNSELSRYERPVGKH